MTGKMGTKRARFNGALAAAALAASVATLSAASADAHWGAPALTSVEVFDRFDGTTLPMYEHEGERFIVGTPGHEYTLRVRNLTGERVLAVTSVDGVNVVTGETASPGQSGYVIDPYASVDINGWRKSLARTAAFYFTDLGDSYAARTGRPGNVGVIGVAVYRERPQPRVERAPREKIAAADAPAGASASSTAQAPESAAAQPAPYDPFWLLALPLRNRRRCAKACAISSPTPGAATAPRAPLHRSARVTGATKRRTRRRWHSTGRARSRPRRWWCATTDARPSRPWACCPTTRATRAAPRSRSPVRCASYRTRADSRDRPPGPWRPCAALR